MGAGLNSDIIFTQSIFHTFIEQGYEVLWPVKESYYAGLCKAYPLIKFVPAGIIRPEYFDIKDQRVIDSIQISPIRWSDSYMKVEYKHVMISKYQIYDLDWETWREHAMWERDRNNEACLMEHLGIRDKPYNLVNKRFGSSGERSVDIIVNNEFQNIEMCEVPGFSLFDWALVFENAEEIHTVSTSSLYMLELLPIEKPIHLYVRKGVETDFSFVDYLFTKPYILHY